MRLGAIFVAFCMILIASSAGAVVYLGFGATTAEAGTVALTVLTALVVYNSVSTRLGVRAVVGSQLTDLSRASADLARQVAEIGRRLAAVESKAETTLDRARAVTDPLSTEMGELGTLIKQLADTVSAHETTLASLARPRRPLSPPEVALDAPRADPVMPADAMAATDAIPAVAVPAPVAIEDTFASVPIAAATEDEMLATLASAIEANRIDLYLQPIVTLPQRKVRYYEAMSRLRTEKGEVLQAADFIVRAERGGLMPKIDNLVVFRCVQVIRRLLVKNREVGLFCNLSGATLNDATVFAQLIEFLEANRAIAPAVVLEFTQSFLRSAGPMENEALAALAERGYRFSLDNVTDLRIEPRELAARGFRFIKIPANLLLGRSGSTAADIHSADLSDLLGRFGIELIAEKIESEGMVVDLLDYDVRFGQGFLFSPPRPVRAEALQGIGERSDVVVRESAATAEPPPAGASGTETAPAADAGKRASALAQLIRGRV
jgi:cyclic-di-GMP phosphodiesterase, flagellum assembly factor TipF